MDDRAAVLEANDAFYRAFTRRDLTGMRDVWAGTPSDVCIHPGWEIQRGWHAIRSAWAKIFMGGMEMRFELGEVTVDVWGDVARIVLVENIWSGREFIGRVAATKLLLRTPAGWRVTLHHGSPIAQEAQEPEPDLSDMN